MYAVLFNGCVYGPFAECDEAADYARQFRAGLAPVDRDRVLVEPIQTPRSLPALVRA